jgi:hypothetical protein
MFETMFSPLSVGFPRPLGINRTLFDCHAGCMCTLLDIIPPCSSLSTTLQIASIGGPPPILTFVLVFFSNNVHDKLSCVHNELQAQRAVPEPPAGHDSAQNTANPKLGTSHTGLQLPRRNLRRRPLWCPPVFRQFLSLLQARRNPLPFQPLPNFSALFQHGCAILLRWLVQRRGLGSVRTGSAPARGQPLD